MGAGGWFLWLAGLGLLSWLRARMVVALVLLLCALLVVGVVPGGGCVLCLVGYWVVVPCLLARACAAGVWKCVGSVVAGVW